MKSLITASALALALANVTAQADTTMKISSWLPPTHAMNSVVFPTWASWIKEATDGRVNVEIEYGLAPPPAQLDLVQDGAADAAWTFHGYTPGRFKLTQIAELPNLGAGAEAASVAHWRIHEKYLSAANEHAGIEVAGLFTHGPGQIQMREPVSSIADMDGKKIRVGGGIQGEIGKRMGITGVAVPAPKVYETLAQGVADGVFMPLGERKFLRLAEVAPYVMQLPNGMYLGSFVVAMSPDFLASLSDADREAVMSVSGEKLSALAGRAWAENDTNGVLTSLATPGNSLVVADESVIDEFAKLTEGMDQDWLDSVADRGIDAAAALQEFREIAQSYEPIDL